MATKKKLIPARKPVRRTFDARPDTMDFRDQMFIPTLVEVPPTQPLGAYRKYSPPILDQGSEGACTGFGLAALANYLLRSRAGRADRADVSPRMLYEMARRYDEWSGENYEGSSARGAMKGWHKHGVCSESLWKYESDHHLTPQRAADAARRPLGAYFRVNHKDLVAMHAAMAEVGVLYVTATVHSGWDKVGPDGHIPAERRVTGGHAFLLVGYDEDGFWVQNSWGKSWGQKGFAHLCYSDWLENGMDVWVGNGWQKKRVLLYAHGGLVSESNALLRVENYLPAMLEAQIYPIAFIWKTDFWTTLTNMLEDALRQRRAEGFLDAAKDFMLDRVDDALEPIARHLTGKAQWSEMKENGVLATQSTKGGARLVVELLSQLVANDPGIELHVAGHSAGSIFNAPLVQLLSNKGVVKSGPMQNNNGLGVPIETCTLWAPACTISLFKETYLPAIDDRQIKKLTLFNLTDDAERDDNCGGIYNKSLLYLVSNAFEERARVPLLQDGEPILGMDKFVSDDKELTELFRRRYAEYIRTPNQKVEGSRDASRAKCHGDFDDDKATVKATLARILGKEDVRTPMSFPRSPSSAKDLRHKLS